MGLGTRLPVIFTHTLKLIDLKVHVLMDINHASQVLLSLLFAGIFFVLPCIESYQKVDLRTITLGVPPQEVSLYDLYGPVLMMGMTKQILLNIEIKTESDHTGGAATGGSYI